MTTCTERTIDAIAAQLAQSHEHVCLSIACCTVMAGSIAQIKEDIARTRACIVDSLCLLNVINDQLDPTRPRE
jgi:hypothetical protein